MSKQDLDERREELIRDERVRQMIRVRAYEIYQMRGPQPGGQAQDWFQAENEVLSFLIAESRQIENESRQVENEPSTASAPVAATPAKATATKKSSPRVASAAKPSSKKRATRKPADTKPKPARKRAIPKEPE